MTIGGRITPATMDSEATAEQTAEIQQLFDQLRLGVRASADYASADYVVKSAAGEVVDAVLWPAGAGVARAYLRAAGTFGDDLGHLDAKRITAWLERLGQAVCGP
jgi:hypothetical protein